MKTFSQTRATFLAIFAQLKRLEGPAGITRAMRALKEREIGKLCYQAELSLLKDMLNVEKSQWDAYKQVCRQSFPS
jgi:hypothetical protein